MFIKWAKEITREWRDIWGGVIVGVWWFWVFCSWLFWFIDNLQDTSEGLNEFAQFFRYKAVPVMIITGIMPSLFVLGWHISKWIYGLYLDYQYFAANGGKRKREDV